MVPTLVENSRFFLFTCNLIVYNITLVLYPVYTYVATELKAG